MLKKHARGLKKRLQTVDPYLRTLYLFNGLSLIGGSIYGLYYGIFLYKNTFSLSVLATDGLLGGVGTWLGYLLGVMIIRRYGYGVSIRTAFGLWALIAFITAIVAGHIAEWFMLIAVVKALPLGIFTAVGDTVMLRDVKTRARSGFLQIVLALEFVSGIILPSAVGAMIALTGGYQWAFITAGIIYLCAIFAPCKLPRPTLSFNPHEVLHTFDRPLYKHHALNRTAAAGFNQLNAFALTIIPFLLLKDEFSVGLLTSVIAVVATAVALGARRIKAQHHIKLGYSAYTIRSLAALAFITIWSAPLMVVWQLVGKLVTPFHDPLQKSIDIHNDSLIMGSDVREKALEINVLNNTLVLIGSTFAFGGFLLITSTGINEQHLILQILIMGYAAWRFLNLAISAKINKWALSPEHIPVRVRLRRKLKFARLGV